MKDKLETVKGSGNVFRDFGYQNADVEQLKSQLAADIIRILDEQKLSVRKAATKTGFDHADFSRIRNADLGRFTIDRLVTVLNRLNQHVEMIRHKTVGGNSNVPHFRSFLQQLRKHNIVLLIGKNILSTPASVHDMVPCIGIFDSKWS